MRDTKSKMKCVRNIQQEKDKERELDRLDEGDNELKTEISITMKD